MRPWFVFWCFRERTVRGDKWMLLASLAQHVALSPSRTFLPFLPLHSFAFAKLSGPCELQAWVASAPNKEGKLESGHQELEVHTSPQRPGTQKTQRRLREWGSGWVVGSPGPEDPQISTQQPGWVWVPPLWTEPPDITRPLSKHSSGACTDAKK